MVHFSHDQVDFDFPPEVLIAFAEVVRQYLDGIKVFAWMPWHLFGK